MLTKPAGRVFPAGLLATVVLLAGCGGPVAVSNSIAFEADSDRVIARAAANNYKFCKVLDEEVCQSPDSNLYFHLPRRLSMSSLDRAIADQITVSNRGHETIVISEYFLTMVDDQNVSYRPSFTGPDGFDETKPFSPALELRPGEEGQISFAQTLNQESEQVEAIAISYKLLGDYVLNNVVVSYRPTSLRGLNDQDEYHDGFEY